ncbi:unnamed protein product [Closterium sp. Yama58-4]|nr:unnamed protein product [Closterium sp. Yama58-4]
MPPKGKPVKRAIMSDPSATAATAAAAAVVALKTTAAGPSVRPLLATAVPSKSSKTLFAEEDSESLTLSARLAASRVEQAAVKKGDKGKGKDVDFKDAVSDAEEESAADDEYEDLSNDARCVNYLDDEDDGLVAHEPKECFEDKAKEDLAAKLRFPLTLLILADHLLEVRRMQSTIKELLGIWENEITESAVYRTLNPGGREFTFYAKATKSSSRIDWVLVSAELLPSVVEACHTRSLGGISDHKCGVKVVLQANLRLHMGPGIRRMPSADTTKPGVERVIEAITERHQAGNSGSFGYLLTKLRAALRRYATEERKRVRATLRHLELAVSGLQQELMRNPHRDDLRTVFSEKESQLAAYLKGENDRLHLLAGVKGEIASKVLPAKVKSKKSRTMITALSSQGVEQRGTKGILEAASQFYASLFAKRPPSGPPCWKPDLLKTLRDEERASLEAVWSEEEVKEALKNMACDKSSGSDGLPKELFERHWDFLGEDFMGFIKQFESSAVIPKEVQEAVTILLHKRVQGIKFIRWCEGLHGGSFTWLLVNGWLCDRVDVCKGVRQGCPLAPYLFLCAVELLCQEAKKRRLGICDDHGDRLAYLGYADGTTLVLNGKRQVGCAVKLLEDFGAQSGLNVNKEKSALLPLGKNLSEEEGEVSGFTQVEAVKAERLLGIWVSPSGSAEVSWDKTLARAAEELVKWQSRHLTTTARVAVVNTYVCPILAFQGQVYPTSEKVWKGIMKLLVNFISGNKASEERHFTLWSRELIFRPRKDGWLEVRDPFV